MRMYQKKDFRAVIFLLPSLCGMLVFYCIPFILSLYYALIENMSTRQFVGLQHFWDTLQNPMFRQGLSNTALYMAVCIPANLMLALSLACAIRRMKRGQGAALLALLLPMMIPSSAMIPFWKRLLDVEGLLNGALSGLGLSATNWPNSRWIMPILAIIYLWKYVGLSVMLFLVALHQIPPMFYEVAANEGAKPYQVFRAVTLPYLMPTTYVMLLFSVVNSFKVFREIYLLYGSYPGRYVYMLQHYMNNQYFSLNMPKLTSANLLLILLLGAILYLLYQMQKRHTDTYSEMQPGGTPDNRNKASFITSGYVWMAGCAALVPPLFLIIKSLTNGNISFSLDAYWELLTNSPVYLRLYWNSIILVIPILVGQCVISPLGAYALERMKWRHKEKLYFLYIIVLLMPMQVLLVPHYLIADWLGLLDSWWAIVLPAIFNPLGILLIRQSMKSFPYECMEAAELDGASEWQVFFRIVLPNLKPIMGIVATLTFAEYWNIVDQAVVLIRSPYKNPLSISLSQMLESNPDIIYAASCFYLIPAVLVFLYARNHFAVKRLQAK